ncbi:hypothetical protein PF007_g28943, partial [Phytophthora fragariae]
MEFHGRNQERRRVLAPYSATNTVGRRSFASVRGPMPTDRYELEARTSEAVEADLVRVRGRLLLQTDRETKTAAAVSGDASAAADKRKARKKPNYLHHWERCAIIKRVAEGEPQAALAREFGVTRAAVCQMYKNRSKILAREPSSEGESEAPPPPTAVASRSKTVALLLATLKARGSNPAAIRRAAARLTFLLIEDVIASFDALNATDATEQSLTASEQIIPFCGVVVGDESAAVAGAFQQMDPGAPTGQIHVKMDVDGGRVCWRLVYLDVPVDIASYDVLVFSTFGNGGAECKAIEALRRVGILEQRISLIMVVCTSLGYEEISTRFP